MSVDGFWVNVKGLQLFINIHPQYRHRPTKRGITCAVLTSCLGFSSIWKQVRQAKILKSLCFLALFFYKKQLKVLLWIPFRVFLPIMCFKASKVSFNHLNHLKYFTYSTRKTLFTVFFKLKIDAQSITKILKSC